jgi:hypothetical protein
MKVRGGYTSPGGPRPPLPTTGSAVKTPHVLTFDELFAHHTLTTAERAALVHHLASLRYRRTVEKMLPESKDSRETADMSEEFVSFNDGMDDEKRNRDRTVVVTPGYWWVRWSDTGELEIVLVDDHPLDPGKIVQWFGQDVHKYLDDELLQDIEFIHKIGHPIGLAAHSNGS